MTPILWFKRRPLLGYYVLTFGISWGGIAVILAARGLDLSPMQPLEGGLIFVAMLLGPSLSGLIVTTLLTGRTGIRALGASLTRWRVPACWYAAALLTIPTILLLFEVFIDPDFAPGFRWRLFAVGIVAGSFEEIGWTGFATPRLLARHRLGFAGLSLGLIWAFWHLLVAFRYNIDGMGASWLLDFAIVYLATLTPYRMLMTWVYSHSLLLAVILHASFTGWLFVFFPTVSLTQGLLWQSVFALALWGAVAMVLLRPPTRADRSASWRQDHADRWMFGLGRISQATSNGFGDCLNRHGEFGASSRSSNST